MASPVNDTYNVASGAGVYAGRQNPVPSWANNLASNSFTALSGTQFRSWANTNITGTFQGTNPLDSIINAYCDMAYDPVRNVFTAYGGGHGDGTCNGVYEFDCHNLTWSTSKVATPQSKYPPSYYNGGTIQPGPLTYPSGLSGNGFFRDDLTDPLDVAYNTPRARASTHMYAAAASRGSTTHYFYLSYGEFDSITGTWSPVEVDFGAQLITFRPQYNNQPLQQGTSVIYDDETDRFFVTLVPGDAGGGWRSGIIVFNPNTRLIENIYESTDLTYGLIFESMNICKVNRDIYGFTKINGDRGLMNQGFIFNMDTKTFKKFTLTGDTGPSRFTPSTNQETIPSWFDGNKIRRWNYESANRSSIMSVNLTPLSGTGAIGDPYILNQTVTTMAGSIPTDPIFIYSRIAWIESANCALVIPRATRDFVAIKVT